MTYNLIAKLTALYEKATPPPWNCRHRASVTEVVSSTRLIMVDSRYNPRVVKPSDQEFIAALVTAWPVIKARLEAAERLRDEAYYTAGTYEGNKDLMNAVDAYDLTKTERTETA